MPFARPELEELIALTVDDVQSSGLAGVDPALPIGVLIMQAASTAGLAHLHYGYLDWISKQAVPWTATGEFLEGWAALKGVLRKGAAAATGPVAFLGTPGIVIPAATVIARSDGVLYTVTADWTVGSNSAVGAPVACNVLGAIGNCAAGVTFGLQAPIAGVNANGSSALALTGGADQESDQALQARMLQAYANAPAGGDAADYVRWALAVPGVTRAWCDPLGYGAGTVIVYVMLDGSESASGGFPQGANGVATLETRDTAAAGDQLIVANAIYPQRPVTALVYVCAPVPQSVDFVIAKLGAQNTASNQAGIEAALAAMFLAKAAPSGTIYPADWYAAISSVVPEFAVTAPTAPVVAAAGSLQVLGTIAFAS